MFDTCILHIGLGKTGTTSIQTAMYLNSVALETQSILYPRISSNHFFLSSCFDDRPERLLFHMDRGRTSSEISEFNKAHIDWLRDLSLEGSCKTLVLSSEFLAGLSRSGIGRLKAFLDGIAFYGSVA